MDASISLIIISVILVVIWFVCGCLLTAVYGYLRSVSDKDGNIYKARTAAMGSVIITFLAVGLILLIIAGSVISRGSGSATSYQNLSDPKNSQGTNVVYNSHAKYVYMLTIFTQVCLTCVALALGICSFYILQHVHVSDTYKTDPNTHHLQSVIGLCVVAGILSLLVGIVSTVQIVYTGYLWNKLSHLKPISEDGTSGGLGGLLGGEMVSGNEQGPSSTQFPGVSDAF